MEVAYASGLSTSVTTSTYAPPHIFPTRTFKSVEPTAFSDFHPDSCKATKISTDGKAQQENEATPSSLYILMAAVYYKPEIDREWLIREHTRVHSDAIKQLTEDWKDEVAINSQ